MKMKRGVSHVYFLQEQGPKKLIKIGYSKGGRARLGCIKQMCPYGMEFLSSLRAHRALERWFHLKFEKDRSCGEWFVPSAYLFLIIDEVRTTGTFTAKPLYAEYDKYVNNLSFVINKLGVTLTQLSKGSKVIYQDLKSNLDYQNEKWSHLTPLSIDRIIKYASSLNINLNIEDFVLTKKSNSHKENSLHATNGGLHA